MRKMIEFIVNNSLRSELETLFGKNSYLSIDKISWSTINKKYIIYSKIFIKETINFEEVFPVGVEYLIKESLKFTGLENNIVLINSFELLD
jgi:hypothetical protein